MTTLYAQPFVYRGVRYEIASPDVLPTKRAMRAVTIFFSSTYKKVFDCRHCTLARAQHLVKLEIDGYYDQGDQL